MQWLRLFLLSFFLLLVACGTADSPTPTPFPTRAAVAPPPLPNSQAIPLNITNLIAAPEASQNAFIRLTGQYYRRPTLVCEADPYPSPATWELTSGEAVALAGGFDHELRSLLPDGLTMTIEGHWLLWRGPVGCGKRAEIQEIWYLQVSRIVDPSPVTQVTLTPVLPGIEVADGSPGGVPAIDTPTAFLTSPATSPDDPFATATLTAGDISPTPEEGVGFDTPVAATPTDGTLPSPVATLTTATPRADNGGGEPTATQSPADLTATPSAGPTVSPDPNISPVPTFPVDSVGTLLMQEEIELMSLNKERLAVNEIHGWPFELLESVAVTVTAVTPANTTLIIAITDEAGNTLSQATGTAGQVVTIGQFPLTNPGIYQIHISASGNSPVDYALMLISADSLNFVFQPMIASGASETAELPAVGEHFWHFVGRAGDQMLVNVVPDSTSDIFLELYGPNAERISPPFVSLGTAGVAEQLEFTLPEDGIYSIRVGEWDFQAASYELTLLVD